MRKILLVAVLLGLFPFIQGCATATYGKAFEQTQTQGQYTSKIYTNAFASQKEATERVNEESKKFWDQHAFIATKEETKALSVSQLS